MRIIGVRASASVVGMLAALSIAATPALASSVPNPFVIGPVTGGIHGFPFDASMTPLHGPHYDYSENEYFFGGLSTDLANGVKSPYEAEMLVRLPVRPSKFNGTVIVEWDNVTGNFPYETSWPPSARYLMEHGYGFVGVVNQVVGLNALKEWDPERYAQLASPSDDFSYDIFSQAIQALRDPSNNRPSVPAGLPGIDPMQGMRVKYIVADGASQSAGSLCNFLSGGYDRGQISVYLITRELGCTYTLKPAPVPIYTLDEETSPSGAPPDTAKYHVWQEAGAAHAPEDWWGYIAAMQDRDLGDSAMPDGINTACEVNRGQINYSEDAIVWWIQQYLHHGTQPPVMPRLKWDKSGNLVRDANGMAVAGVRQPFIQVPVAYNAGTGCPLFGTYRPWTRAKIQLLYRTHADYVADVERATQYDVHAGWLLPQDARNAIAQAKAFTAPWKYGSCYDTNNQTGNETGAVSGQIYADEWNPELLTLGQSVPLGGAEDLVHEANCDVIVRQGG